MLISIVPESEKENLKMHLTNTVCCFNFLYFFYFVIIVIFDLIIFQLFNNVVSATDFISRENFYSNFRQKAKSLKALIPSL